MPEQVQKRMIQDEIKDSYIDYAMSVIVGRALPDVRDGLKPAHRRSLFAMKGLGMVHNKPHKKSARIVGECFVKDTLVPTIRGIIPIQDIKKGDNLYTQKGVQAVSELYEQPKQALLLITLNNGLTNTVTKSQMLKILNPDLSITWKKASEIRKGDYVVSKPVYPEIKNEVKLRGGKYLNKDLAYLVGFFLSDGWMEKATGRVGFFSTSRKIIENVQRILKSEFNYSPSISVKKSGKYKEGYSVKISNSEIKKFWLSNFNFEKAEASTKVIPEQVLRSPKEVVYSLLSGLIDGDGCVHSSRNVIHYGSVSYKLINQLQVLLQSLGIFSARYRAKQKDGVLNGKTIHANYPLFYLEVIGKNCIDLISNLDLKNQEKAEKLQVMLNSKKTKSNFDNIPYLSKHVFSELSKKHLVGGWFVHKNGEKFRSGIKYDDNCKIRYSKDLHDMRLGKAQIINLNILNKLEAVGSPLAEFIKEVLSDGLCFLKVKKVEAALPEKTYDIQVKGHHEFIANGVLSHNCLGKYHPHGDVAVYDTIVRMAQPFSLRYTLVDGQGNWGSVDGDNAAAQRYTECRMTRIAEELLDDLDKETVDMVPNFDGTLKEPVVLPAKLPNLLVNGSSGIAVGMATNIPPHNLREVCDAIIVFLDNPDCDVNDLPIKGPDFPTGGIIQGTAGIRSAYAFGRGKIRVRAKADIEKSSIIVTEIPYMVNKATLVEEIAVLVRDKVIEGITDLRDESDRDGMRIVIEFKKDANAEVILNQLFKHSQLQSTFGVIMLALHNNQPRVMGLKEILGHYINHRKDVIVRRTRFDLKKAEDAAHILEGLKIALKSIDSVIKTIKASANPAAAKVALVKGFSLTEVQAQAILDMKLQRLTSLEQEKIQSEYLHLLELIKDYKDILSSEPRVINILKSEVLEMKETYGDDRRSEIVEVVAEMVDEDLIPDEDVVVIATRDGYIKKIPINAYQHQNRGGKGIIGMETKEEDIVEHLFTTNSHSYILAFSNTGRVYWLKAYEIPTASRYAKGKAIVNILNLSENEKINAMIPIKKFEEQHYLIMATKKGLVKKTSLKAYSNPRKGGIIGMGLRPGDEMVQVRLTPGKLRFIIASRDGMAVKFDEHDVRPTGRGSTGVRGITLVGDDEVIGLEVALESGTLVSITENGFGKRSSIPDYRLTKRGGKGVINIQTSERNGRVVGIKTVRDVDEVMFISAKGVVIRVLASDISLIGRNTQGVRLMRLNEGDKVKGCTRVIANLKSDAE